MPHFKNDNQFGKKQLTTKLFLETNFLYPSLIPFLMDAAFLLKQLNRKIYSNSLHYRRNSLLGKITFSEQCVLSKTLWFPMDITLNCSTNCWNVSDGNQCRQLIHNCYIFFGIMIVFHAHYVHHITAWQ